MMAMAVVPDDRSRPGKQIFNDRVPRTGFSLGLGSCKS